MNDRLGLARKLPLAAVALGGLLVVGQARAAGPYSLYVTVSGAGNHDGSSLANAMTLAEATQAAVAGDVVFVQKGLYQLPQLTTSFNHSGTAQAVGALQRAPVSPRAVRVTSCPYTIQVWFEELETLDGYFDAQDSTVTKSPVISTSPRPAILVT